MRVQSVKKTIIIAFAACATLAVTAIVIKTVSERTPTQQPQPTSPATTTEARVTRVLDGPSSRQGAAPTSTPDSVKLDPTKEAQLRLEEQQKSNARSSPEPSLTAVARKLPRQPLNAAIETASFKPIPGSALAEYGAIVIVRPPFSNDQYHIENTWYADNPDLTMRTFVFAGSVTGPGGQQTDQGVVVLQKLQYVMLNGVPVLKNLETHAYTSTVSTGSFHVIGADAIGPKLLAADGTVVHFDLASRTLATP